MPSRLYRSRDDRMLFGVAGGMARYLGVDPAITRLVWVALVLAAGAGVLLYIVAAIIIPEEPAGHAAESAAQREANAAGSPPGAGPGAANAGTNTGAILVGLLLVGLGAWFLLQRFLPAIDGRVVWPAVLIVLGLALVLGAMRRRV